MFLDRQDNRKQVEQAYRKELKNQVDNKRSRVISNKDYRPEKEAFSLIANIEKEQNQRKQKKQQYYDDLKMQMEAQKREKQEQEAQKKRKQIEEENKIKQEQMKLQERYSEQIKKQKNKGNHSTEPKYEPPQNKKKKKQLLSKDPNEPIKKQPSQLETRINKQKPSYMQSTTDNAVYDFQSNTEGFTIPSPVNLYPNKIENQTFNYIPRNSYKESYYKQLLVQRRKLQEQANQISQLNRMFNAQRYKRKQQSRGLQQLRNLEKMLDSKNVQYLDMNYNDPRHYASQSNNKLKPLNRVQRGTGFSQKTNKDEWRKLD